MKNQHFSRRFGFALHGIRIALKENSFRTQLFFAAAALVALFVLQPAVIWWALVLFACVIVLAGELFNTALEAICDFVSPEYQAAIKIAKDTAAGGVLVLSLGSLVIALAMVVSVVLD